MKKVQMILAILAVAVFAFQAAAFAGSVEGAVKSVDPIAKKLEISAASGSEWVSFAATTTWPSGVTDPLSLVGKQVIVTTDAASGSATSVEVAEAAAPAAPAAY